jgi:hypothetical protein
MMMEEERQEEVFREQQISVTTETTMSTNSDVMEEPVPVPAPAPAPVPTTMYSGSRFLCELRLSPTTLLFESALPLALAEFGVTDDEFAEFLVHCNAILNRFHERRANYRAYIITIFVICLLLFVPSLTVSMLVFLVSFLIIKRKIRQALRECFIELLAFVEQQSYSSVAAVSSSAALPTISGVSGISSSGFIMKGLFAKHHINVDVNLIQCQRFYFLWLRM